MTIESSNSFSRLQQAANRRLCPEYGANMTTSSGSIYRLGLALLDLKDPTQLRCRTDEWIFGPKARYEWEGDVDDVVFPCGWTLENGTVHMYCGAADSCIAYVTAKLDHLLEYVMKFRYNE